MWKTIPIFFLGVMIARADTLWFNGTYDNRDSLVNEAQVPINTGKGYVLQDALVYDDFVVPVGQVWTITSVFSNDQMAYYGAVSTATWQIREGVSSGNGGILVASGDTAATQTAIAPIGGFYYGDPEYQITARVTGLVLTAGTYWLAVAPDSAGYYGDQSYIETTSGANAVGNPKGNDGNSFVTSTYPPGSYNFTPTTTALAGDGDGPNIDFSMGILGTSLSTVPEPGTFWLIAIAGAALLVGRRYFA